MTTLAANFTTFEKGQKSVIDEFIKNIISLSEKFKELIDYYTFTTRLADLTHIVKKKQSDLFEICDKNSIKITAEVTNLLAASCSILQEIK